MRCIFFVLGVLVYLFIHRLILGFRFIPTRGVCPGILEDRIPYREVLCGFNIFFVVHHLKWNAGLRSAMIEADSIFLSWVSTGNIECYILFIRDSFLLHLQLFLMLLFHPAAGR